MTILVTGGRGRISRALVGLLHEQGRPLRVASSDPTTVDAPDDVPVVPLSFAEPESFAAALSDVRAVFLYAATDNIVEFVARAAEAGVEHVVLLSSLSVDDPDADDPIADRHASVERALADAPFTVTVLRPGAFATNALQWAKEIRAGGPVRMAFPNVQSAPLDETDIAAVAAVLLTRPEGRGGVYPLTGPAAMSFADQIAIIGAALGTDLAVEQVDKDTARTELADLIGPVYAKIMVDMWERYVGRSAQVTKDVQAVLGREPRTFAEWTRANLAAFG